MIWTWVHRTATNSQMAYKMDQNDYHALTDQFEAETLDARSFSHVDHIAVACQMLQRYDFLDAAVRYSDSLKNIATKAGAPDKFNTTITLAFLSLLSEKMAMTPHDTFVEFIEKNPDLVSRTLLGSWYSSERMSSPLARQAFLMPDRFQN
jgi:hypothetical protein